MATSARKPRIHKDALGNYLTVGTRVAFNYSGDVATGEIVKITSEYHIKRDAGFHGSNPISKVKRPYSLLVIHDSGTQKAINDALARQYDSLTIDATRMIDKEEERTKRVKGKLTNLIHVIADAWDLDEVRLHVKEVFGEDALSIDSQYHSEDLERVLS